MHKSSQPGGENQTVSLDLLHYRIGSHFEASRQHAEHTRKTAIASGLLLGMALGFEKNPRRWGLKEGTLAVASVITAANFAWEGLQQLTERRAAISAWNDAVERWRQES